MLTKLEGYLLIPHELLHVIGYRLAGKRCLYRWGDRYVTTLDPMSRNEQLVGLLFPFGVCVLAGLILIPTPFIAVFIGGVAWAIILTAIPILPFFYAFASIGDLRRAYLLIYQKKPQDKTPFDFLFWPATTDNPQQVRAIALTMMACVIIFYTIYLVFF